LATIYAIKALLLEEVLLNLLKVSGYSTVNNVGTDATLKNGSAGIEVKGRGWNHQIDAIADFTMSPPFSYPIRLLLEAKFYADPIGIDIIRNAVGVLKDVSEFWVSRTASRMAKPRFHYQYAVFTSSSFTFPAQQYAFAQDIYLIKLENNRYFIPIVQAIDSFTFEDFNGESNKKINIQLSTLRKKFRESLKNSSNYTINMYISDNSFSQDKFNRLFQTSTTLSSSYLGMISHRFPIFLTPSPSFNIEHLINNPTIRICWDSEYWYIVKRTANCRTLLDDDILFSFDLPEDIFKLYADNNMLTPRRALDLKGELMSSIQIVFKSSDQRLLSSIELRLDDDWLENAKRHMDGNSAN
jgi:uncharacterized protein YqfB (UPF0267 family)